MNKILWTCAAFALLLLAGTGKELVNARPPDLPVKVGDTFAPPRVTTEEPPLAEESEPPLQTGGNGWNGWEVLQGFWTNVVQLFSGNEDRLTLPSGDYLKHAPGYYPPSPGFPLPRELASQEQAAAILLADLPHAACPHALPSRVPYCPAQGCHTHVEVAASVLEQLARLNEAQELFTIAERCRDSGDFDKAHTCYLEVRRLAPCSRYAQQALTRLQVLDEQRSTREAPFQQAKAAAQDGAEASELSAEHELGCLCTIAERCIANGDLAKALTCYREVARMLEGTVHGVVSAWQARQIEQQLQRGGAEAPAKSLTVGLSLRSTNVTSWLSIFSLGQRTAEILLGREALQTAVELAPFGIEIRVDELKVVPEPQRDATERERPAGEVSESTLRRLLDSIPWVQCFDIDIDATRGTRVQSTLRVGESDYTIRRDESGLSIQRR